MILEGKHFSLICIKKNLSQVLLFNTGKGLTNSVFGLQIWLMRHEFNQNGSVRCFLQNELTSCGITITGVLRGDRRHEPMTQTKQLKEFRFLDQIILDGDFPLTKHAVSRREYC